MLGDPYFAKSGRRHRRTDRGTQAKADQPARRRRKAGRSQQPDQCFSSARREDQHAVHAPRRDILDESLGKRWEARGIENLTAILKPGVRKRAGKVARHLRAGDVQQRPTRRIESPSDELGQRRDISGSAGNIRETRCRAARGGIADRENRHVSLVIAVGKGADAVGAGREQRLDAREIERRTVEDDDPQQRLDQHFDALAPSAWTAPPRLLPGE